MKKVFAAFSALVLMCSTCASCARTDYLEERSHYAFGTVITAKIWGNPDSAADAAEKCFDELDRLDAVFSANSEKSELSRLNANAFAAAFPVSDELFYVIKTSLEYCSLSDGALDISLGRLVKLWAIGTENERVPAESEISPLLAADYTQIELDEESKTVHFLNEYVQIDLGAVAKGYAGDRMLEILSGCDVTGAVISLGGNIVAFGSKPDGGAFTIGVADPTSPSTLIATVDVSSGAVVTSGDYQRYFEENGARYHHILDAATGRPSESGIAGVTIICESSFEADCLSTAVFVLGKEKGLRLLAGTGAEAVIIERNGAVSTTPGISNCSYNYLGGTA